MVRFWQVDLDLELEISSFILTISGHITLILDLELEQEGK